MKDGKTISEKMREDSTYCCFGDSLADMIGVDPNCAGNTCRQCRVEMFAKLADEIDAEKREALGDAIVCYEALPRDAQGNACQLDDLVWHDGRRKRVVAISHKGKVCLRDWERIDEDARKTTGEYWGCVRAKCDECPALIDGETPDEHYGVDSCESAQKLDLLRRQRRLDGVVE